MDVRTLIDILRDCAQHETRCDYPSKEASISINSILVDAATKLEQLSALHNIDEEQIDYLTKLHDSTMQEIDRLAESERRIRAREEEMSCKRCEAERALCDMRNMYMQAACERDDLQAKYEVAL